MMTSYYPYNTYVHGKMMTKAMKLSPKHWTEQVPATVTLVLYGQGGELDRQTVDAADIHEALKAWVLSAGDTIKII
jgi:hypothetical protein